MKFKRDKFNCFDCFILLFLIFLSLFTRLWKLGFPSVVVFDEVYFGNFTNYYIKREFYSDIHPPFGKLVMALIAKLTGYDGSIIFSKDHRVGTAYTKDEIFYVSLRITPCIFSSFCPILLYCSLRNFGCSSLGCTCASVMALFDGTSLTEGRFILSDGMLHFFSCLYIFSYSLFFRKPTYLKCFFVGIAMGIALSCKLTAMGLVGVTGVSQIIWIIMKRPSLVSIMLRGFLLLIPCITIWYFAWVIHFSLLKYKDTSNTYSSGIVGVYLLNKTSNLTYPGRRLANRFLIREIIKDNIETHENNMRITMPHPFSSLPINWPLLLDKGVLFYSANKAKIYCIGNPWTYWVTSLFIVLSILSVKHYNTLQMYTFLGWFCCYFPFVSVPRVMYAYHYIIPLFFACLNLTVFIENAFRKKTRKIMYTVMIFVSFLSYIFYYPWMYGVQSRWYDKLTLLDRWDTGPPEKLEILDSVNTTLMRSRDVYLL